MSNSINYEEVVVNPVSFSVDIIKLSISSGTNIIETIVEYCEENEYEMEDIIPLLDGNIIERIRACGIEERYIIPKEKYADNKLF